MRMEYRNKSKKIISNISMEIKAGEIVGLLGPNGSGKTTCFYMISGLLRPDHGKIFLDHEDITSFPIFQRAKLGISYLPQETSVFQSMNVKNNIMAILELNYSSKTQRKLILEELLEEFNLTRIANSEAYMLSGGEMRRLEIARTIAMKPKFILLDEPFAGVDPISILEICEIIKKLKNKSIGILITDHNVRDTLLLVDKAYIIYDSHILASGAKEEIINSIEVKKAYLGENYL